MLANFLMLAFMYLQFLDLYLHCATIFLVIRRFLRNENLLMVQYVKSRSVHGFGKSS